MRRRCRRRALQYAPAELFGLVEAAEFAERQGERNQSVYEIGSASRKLAEVLRRFVEAAEHAQRVAEVEEGKRIFRLHGERTPEAGGRIGQSRMGHESPAEAALGVEILRRQLRRPLPGGETILALRLQAGAEQPPEEA